MQRNADKKWAGEGGGANPIAGGKLSYQYLVSCFEDGRVPLPSHHALPACRLARHEPPPNTLSRVPSQVAEQQVVAKTESLHAFPCPQVPTYLGFVLFTT